MLMEVSEADLKTIMPSKNVTERIEAIISVGRLSIQMNREMVSDAGQGGRSQDSIFQR